VRFGTGWGGDPIPATDASADRGSGATVQSRLVTGPDWEEAQRDGQHGAEVAAGAWGADA
jgi:hypothetical protein